MYASQSNLLQSVKFELQLKLDSLIQKLESLKFELMASKESGR